MNESATSVDPDVTSADASPTGRRSNPLHAVGSIVLCVLLVLELVMAMLAMALIVPSFVEIFEDFDATLPALTVWLLSMPPLPMLVATSTLIVVVIAKEVLIRNRLATLIINLVLLLLTLLWLPLLAVALFLPLVDLMQTVP